MTLKRGTSLFLGVLFVVYGVFFAAVNGLSNRLTVLVRHRREGEFSLLEWVAVEVGLLIISVLFVSLLSWLFTPVAKPLKSYSLSIISSAAYAVWLLLFGVLSRDIYQLGVVGFFLVCILVLWVSLLLDGARMRHLLLAAREVGDFNFWKIEIRLKRSWVFFLLPLVVHLGVWAG